jgi:RNA polymerase sigma-70 factor (ECF subfamily)
MHARLASLEELLESRDWILGLARTLVREPADAEDLAQEAMLAALKSPPPPDRPLRAWLARALANLARRRWRSEERREQRETLAERREPSEELSPAHLVERIALQNDVAAAVLRLEEPYRSAVILRYFQMLAPAEIARRQGISADSVRQRLKRGRERLRELLDSRYGDRRIWSGGLIALLQRPAKRAPLHGKPLLAGASLLALVAIGGSAWILASKPGTQSAQADQEGMKGASSSRVRRAGGTWLEAPTADPGRTADMEPAPAMEPGHLEVLVSWASDGKPATGESVLVRLTESDAPFPQDRVARADAEGRALFELPAGEVRVGLLRGLDDYAWVAVRPGERSELKLAVPEGITVAGSVVREDGRALARAEIWLSECWDPLVGHAVGFTDDNGAFAVRSVQLDGGNWLGARAEGHAASPAMHFEGVAPGGEIEVEIVLREGGGVEGIALDADGSPVQGAEIQAGFESRSWAAGPGSPPCRTTTDAAGRFFLSGLAHGRQPLLARALGYGSFTGEVSVGSIRQGAVSIVLPQEARVQGIVTDAKGAAVSGASIGCGEAGAFAPAQPGPARTDASCFGVWLREESACLRAIHSVARTRSSSN